MVGEVAAAGAASSLIFLVSFAMVHWAAVLARRRTEGARPGGLPLAGAALCLGLAAFQAYAVPEAGAVVVSWLAVGGILYLALLAPGARLVDVAAEASDPDLARLRGRSPLVLVPIANPARAASLASVAATIRTPGVGRILFLSVVPIGGGRLGSGEGAPWDVDRPPDEERLRLDETPRPLEEDPRALLYARGILGEALRYSLETSLVAETLFTLAPDPWDEIARVARVHGCETVLLGLPDLTEPGLEARLEGLIAKLEADVVIVRASYRWRMEEAARVLVPVRGRRDHSHLRARLIASLSRTGARGVTFLRIAPPGISPEARRRFEEEVRAMARDEATGPFEVALEYTDRRREAIVRHASAADLVVMGTVRRGRHWQGFGKLVLAIAQETEVPLVLIGRPTGRTGRGGMPGLGEG